MRSLSEERMSNLKQSFGADNFAKLEFVKADLLEEESFINAMKGIDYVIHVASPIQGENSLTLE